PPLNASNITFKLRRIPQLLGSVATAAYLTLSPQTIYAQENQISQSDAKVELMTEAKQRGLLNILGNRVAELMYIDESWRLVLEKGVLEKKQDSPLVLSPIPEYFHNVGLDEKLDNGSLGVTIPRKNFIPQSLNSPNPLEGYSRYFQLPNSVIQFSKDI